MDLGHGVSVGGDGSAFEDLEDAEYSPSVYRAVASPTEKKLALGSETVAVSGSTVTCSRKGEVRKEQRMFCSGRTGVGCPFVHQIPVCWG